MSTASGQAAAPRGTATGAGYTRMAQRFRRALTLPEGIAIPVEIAPFAERVSAAAIDFVVLHMIFGIYAYLMLSFVDALGLTGRTESVISFLTVLLGYFGLRVAFFTVMELHYQGQTLGKKVIGLRVIDRRGGPLTSGAVIVRNLTREVEMFLPFQYLLVLPFVRDTELLLAALAWLAIFVLFPLFNRDRMRLGDLIGGTWVIRDPRPKMERDIAAIAAKGRDGANEPAFIFTAQQLEHYGIYELQTLERVLRTDGPEQGTLQRRVAGTIAEKIGYDDPRIDTEAATFLNDFYVAQRERLETLLRHGERRERKRG